MIDALQRAARLAAAATMSAALCVTPASAASERVRSACTSDYLRFCSQYDPDSFQTVNCMMRHQSKVTPVCRKAFLDENPNVKKRIAGKQR